MDQLCKLNIILIKKKIKSCETEAIYGEREKSETPYHIIYLFNWHHFDSSIPFLTKLTIYI